MKPIHLTRMALLLTAGAVCVGSFLFAQLTLPSHAEAASQRPMRITSFLRQPKADSGFPVRLRIPSIEVDAAIESVGLTSKKAMDVPKDPNNVGWYNLGSRPGQHGSAVMAGHLDWYNGQTAVFRHLHRLRAGDFLSVETDKGRFLQFVVREVRTYQPYEYVPDVFQKNDGIHLNLVTCGGVWDTVQKIYGKRLVVFTEAVGPIL